VIPGLSPAGSRPVVIGALIGVILFVLWYLRYYRVTKQEVEEGAVGNLLSNTLQLMRTDITLVWKPLIGGVIGGFLVLLQTTAFTLQGIFTLDPTVLASAAAVALSSVGLAGMWPFALRTLLWAVVTAAAGGMLFSLLGAGVDEGGAAS